MNDVGHMPRLRPLVLALGGSVLALGAASAFGTTRNVTNCNDSGTGSLRDVIAAAISGDIVTAQPMGCSSISLTTGELVVKQNDLTIVGPPNGRTIIGQKYKGQAARIFYHSGTGTLKLVDLVLAGGKASEYHGYYGDVFPMGGCVFSKHDVYLFDTSVVVCGVYENSGSANSAEGGGIYAKHDVTLKYSNVSYNTAGAHGIGLGGGVFVGHNLVMGYSTIAGNTADGSGGGAFANGDVMLTNSTISTNHANEIGGLFVSNATNSTIVNSTISGNVAVVDGGGAAVFGNLTLQHATIAFNTAGSTGGSYAAGLSVTSDFSGETLNIADSILSNNTYTTAQSAIVGSDFASKTRYGGTLTTMWTKSLVFAPSQLLPPQVITHVCPLLGPLRDNGGSTETHALLSHSPAVDAASSTSSLHEDQRGDYADSSPYAYPRVSGSASDMGAYEVQKKDIVFNAVFEGCP